MRGAPPLTLSRRLAGGRVLRRGSVSPYRTLETVDGEPHLTRGDLVSNGRAGLWGERRRPLACFVHLTDLQLADVQSPARFEFFNREFADPRFRTLLPVQRPQEALAAHVAEAMVETINRIPEGPVSGRPLELAVTSGDAIDNAQWNELMAFLTLLDGGAVTLDSGGPGLEGVQAPWWEDDVFWKPDGVGSGVDAFVRDHGFPVYPGLLERALQPLQAAGLDLPWLGCYGNHEAFVQGVGVVTPTLAEALVGDLKPVWPPEGFDRDTVVETFVQGAEALWSGTGVRVTPDAARRPVSRREFVAAHQGPDVRPAGHGFTPANRRDGTAYYAYDTPVVRFIALDTTAPAGGPEGRIGQAQLSWLEERLVEVASHYRGRDGAAVHTAADDRLVVVFSHHGLATLTNTRGLHDGEGLSEPDAARVLELLHRFDNVVLWLNGHTHHSQVRAREDPRGGGAGFWEVTTCSLADWPSQARIVELLDVGEGMLAIACTMVDHDSPVEPVGPAHLVDLAALHRELAANVPWAGIEVGLAGSPADRNVILPLRAPFPLERLRAG